MRNIKTVFDSTHQQVQSGHETETNVDTTPRPLKMGALLLLAALVALTSCASDETSDDPPPRDQEAARTEAALKPEAQPDNRRVQITKVIDAKTYTVTPKDVEDPLFGETFEFAITDIEVPVEGDCGYDEARTEVEKYFEPNPVRKLSYDSDEPVNSAGVHLGGMTTVGKPSSVRNDLVANGYALPTAEGEESPILPQLAEEARDANLGLYASCDDFGER